METNKDILEQIKMKSQTKMDEAYFEQFRANMLEEIKKHPKTKVFYLRPGFWLSSAAASVIVIFSIQFLNTEKPLSFANLSEHEITSYVEEHTDPVEHLPEIKNVKTVVKTHKDSTHQINRPNPNETKIVSELPDFVSSADLLDELSDDDIYQYMNAEEFDLEELEITN